VSLVNQTNLTYQVTKIEPYEQQPYGRAPTRVPEFS